MSGIVVEWAIFRGDLDWRAPVRVVLKFCCRCSECLIELTLIDSQRRHVGFVFGRCLWAATDSNIVAVYRSNSIDR